jgi:Lar family restriction alleviation protein
VSELKPCPFCGGSNVEAVERYREGSESRWHRIECSDCEIHGPETEGCSLNYYGAARVDEVAQEAVTLWNTRASPTPTNDGEGLQALLTNASAKGAAEQRMIGAIEAQFDIHAMDPEDFAEMWVEISATLDELIASVLAALNQGGCDQCGKRNGHHPACIYKKGP